MANRFKAINVLFLSCLFSCSEMNPISPFDKRIEMSVLEDERFSISTSTFLVNPGEDYTLSLTFVEGYAFASCDYENYDYTNISISETSLTLFDIQFPQQIHIKSKRVSIDEDPTLTYHLNTGEWIEEGKEGDSYLLTYDLSYHIRANTDQGLNRIKKEGYQLVGWNTKEDLSGEEISLGSRYTIADNHDLYAHWIQESDASLFTFTKNKDGVTLKYFKGSSQDILVIPAYIQGFPVVSIDVGFVQYVSIENLYLPSTLVGIENGAFQDCQINTLHFYDNITDISDDSFYHCEISHYQINAALAPRFQGHSDNTRFADDVDNLMLAKDQKKMVFFSGCSMSYGLNSQEVEKNFSDYLIFNLGNIGGTNAAFQMDILSQFVQNGDILIHAPEEPSPFQLLSDLSCDVRTFMMIEGNYDLLQYVDFSMCKQFLSALADFNQNRLAYDPGSYEEALTTFNHYGDYIGDRTTEHGDVSLNDYTYLIDMTILNRESLENRNKKYQLFNEKGCKILFSFAPMNLHGLPEGEEREQKPALFEKYFRDYEAISYYTVISTIDDYLLPGRYFYDLDYHLNEEGAQIRTERLIRDLKEFI